MTLRSALTHRWRSLTGQKRAAQQEAQAAFEAVCADLRPGDLAIDLGANLGIYTEKLAATGADVIAFEPDPHAFAKLAARMAGQDHVTLKNAAAGASAGTLPFYRTAQFDADPDRHSTSSSLLAEKRNVTDKDSLSVEVVDFTAFLADLDRDVVVIKVDIEGAEVDLMERLLDHPVRTRIDHIFVETHERAIPSLAERTAALRARSDGATRPQINWEWH